MLNCYLKNYKNAIQNFDEALKINPKFASAYLQRAFAKGKLNLHKASISDYRKSLLLDSKNDKSYYFIALEYEKLNDFKSALLNLNKAIEINEYLPEYYLKRGKLLLKTSKVSEGCKDISKSNQLGGIYKLKYPKINCK